MTKRAVLLSLAVLSGTGACAKATKPALEEGPLREVRVLEKGDPALRRISFAAAEYLKSMSTSGEVGFRGVWHKRELDIELTRDIVMANAFVDVSQGGSAQSASGCTAAPSVGRGVAVRAPRDPATGATTAPAPAQTAGTDNRACAGVARSTYAFSKFRVAADTAYVETSGLTSGLSCMILNVKEGGGWKVLMVKPSRPEACGK